MATSTSPPGNNGRGNQRLVRLLVSLLVFVVVCLIFVFSVWQFGFVSGEEFDPATFERRSFYYYEIPIVGIQVIPITRATETNSLETHIAKLLKVKPSSGGDWDLISLYRSAQKYADGDASLLCTYLDIEVDGTLHWLSWSNDHPQLAKVLWPAVADLAQNHMYIFVPRLMELAKAADDPVSLQTQIDQHLAVQYATLAKKQAELDKHLLAVTLFDEALGFDSQDEASVELRAASLAKLTEEESTRLAELQALQAESADEPPTATSVEKPTAEKPAT